MARSRRLAMTRGPLPVRTWERSSSQTTLRTQWIGHHTAPSLSGCGKTNPSCGRVARYVTGDGRVDAQAADPGAEPALPAVGQHSAVALVTGDGPGRAAVEHAEPPLADPADRQALQQRAALPGRAGPGASHHAVRQVADVWITLAAVAAATGRVRLGPMVTPLARRRPVKVARETVTLDRLSGGRLHPRCRPGQRPFRQRVVQGRRRDR